MVSASGTGAAKRPAAISTTNASFQEPPAAAAGLRHLRQRETVLLQRLPERGGPLALLGALAGRRW